MDPASADNLLQLVFQGECLAGHDRDAVRAALARALKLDTRRAARLFSGRRIVLRRELDVKAAHRTIAQFAAMGALLRAEPSQPRKRRGGSRSSRRRRARPAPRWQRLLRLAAIGVLCVVASVVVGVALGPMLGGGWSDAEGPAGTAVATGVAPIAAPPAPMAPAANALPAPQAPAAIVPAPAAQSPVVQAPAAPAPPAAAADEEDPLQSMPAPVTREYTLRYLRAPNPKAFAISPGGAHGWHAGAASENEAREKAIARCLVALPPGDDGCRIVDVDGEWTD